MKEYKEMLKYSAKHFKEVLKLAQKFNIELKKEDEFPKDKLIIMKCEDQNLKGSSVFVEFKKRKFFKSKNN